MSPSTDRRFDQRLTFAFEDIPDSEFLVHLGVSPKEVKKARAQRLLEQRDPAAIAKILEGLPAPTLYVLGALVNGGGFMMVSDLAHELAGSLKRLDVELALAPAFASFIAVAVQSRWQAGPAAMLVAPAAEHVARMLAEIDVVDLDPRAVFELDSDQPDDGRGLLSLCAALLQFDIKLTNDDRPHRTALKRLSKQLGLGEEELESQLRSARFASLLEPDLEGILRPSMEILERAARGHYPPDTLPGALAEFLAKHGEVPLGVVERWGARLGTRNISKALARLPGFTLGKIGGVAAVRWKVPVTSAAAGHITPSFEVFLPPEASIVDVVRAVAVSELTRIDRMIVARVTKASIEVAGGRGLAPLPMLRGVSRTPLPQNVEAAIQDWAGNTITARTEVGRVIVVDAAHDERVASALAPFVPSRLAAGVFVVDGEVSMAKLGASLSRLGIHGQVAAARKPTARVIAMPALPDPASRRLRQRVGAWRVDQPFEGHRDHFLADARARWESHGGEHSSNATLSSTEIEHRLTDWEVGADYMLEDHEWKAAELALSRMDRAAALAILNGPLPRLRRRDLGIDLIARLIAAAPPDVLLDAVPDEAPDLDPDDRSLSWSRSELLPQLQEAARRGTAVMLERDDGKRESVRVTRVSRQGSLWMVLGERTRDELGVAYPLHRIAALGSPATETLADGAVPVAGHLPCPCGSGKRYRQCCRPS